VTGRSRDERLRGGDRVVWGSPCARPKARRHEPVRRGRRWQRDVSLHAEWHEGTRPPRMRRPQRRGGSGGFRPFAAGRFLAMRHGMRPGHRAISPKPRPRRWSAAPPLLRTTARGKTPPARRPACRYPGAHVAAGRFGVAHNVCLVPLKGRRASGAADPGGPLTWPIAGFGGSDQHHLCKANQSRPQLDVLPYWSFTQL